MKTEKIEKTNMGVRLGIVLLSAYMVSSCGAEGEGGAPEKAQKAKVSSSEKGRAADAKPPQVPHETTPQKRPEKPNVVVILIDALRPDYLGFYGFEYETAPFLSSLAEESLVFENAYSTSSWTAPSTSSLFTSLYPPQHGVVQGFRAHRGLMAELKESGRSDLSLNQLPQDVPTLAEKMKEAGYRTLGFASNINVGKEIGFTRGFDEFEKKTKAPAEEFYEKLRANKEFFSSAESPFFLYLHLNDVHSPYDKRAPHYRPSKDKKKDFAARYRSEIGYTDEVIKKVFGLLGDRDDTVFVILSDHGEEFWDHGGTEHGPKLYRELHRILLMIGYPGAAPARIARNASILDVYPTIMELVNAKREPHVEGTSLATFTEDSARWKPLEEKLMRRTLFGHRVFSSRRKVCVWAAVQGRWRLVDWWGSRRKLFDERMDPGNLFDKAVERKGIVEELSKRLDSFKARMETHARGENETEISLDNALLERLERLGYTE